MSSRRTIRRHIALTGHPSTRPAGDPLRLKSSPILRQEITMGPRITARMTECPRLPIVRTGRRPLTGSATRCLKTTARLSDPSRSMVRRSTRDRMPTVATDIIRSLTRRLRPTTDTSRGR
jgi:hypothetical protein